MMNGWLIQYVLRDSCILADWQASLPLVCESSKQARDLCKQVCKSCIRQQLERYLATSTVLHRILLNNRASTELFVPS